jgi:menaquinone-dependent protoporphyrinogen oxidase
MSEKISRRKFLKAAGITTAALAVTLCGGGALAGTIRRKPHFPQVSIDQNQDFPAILVAYASKSGVTAEIAERIAATIAEYQVNVDLLPVDQVKDVQDYHTVLIGSGIYMGQLMPAAVSFIETNQAVLSSKNVGVFFSCLTLAEDNEETRSEVTAYLAPARGLIALQHEGMFAGAVKPQHLTVLERGMLALLNTPAGDFRDWQAIDDWAVEVASSIA